MKEIFKIYGIYLNKLEKVRYIIKINKRKMGNWFLKDYKKATYIAVAEIEMPKNQFEPNNLPNYHKK